MAAETAAAHYLRTGRERAAQGYLREAFYAYGRWGATALQRRLEAAHPFLTQAKTEPVRDASASTTHSFGTTTRFFGTTTVVSTPSSSSGAASALDFDSLLKATRALSMEVNLNALLDKLMRTVVENAGAEKGALLLVNDEGGLALQAAVRADGASLAFVPGTPLDRADDLPRSVVYFVFRSKTDVVLGNAAQDPDFGRDPHIARRAVKSVLCVPVLNRGEIVGVLYLENNLAADAFTPQRAETVRLLAAQAGVSIENARLYENLERK
ncbi:MAG: GAF domain-containing protein, partial [Bacteroidia bacterium]|nr:GAF domain-containing protein [Bacteroidia bacterium]